MAIYECRKCDREEFVPRRFRFHLGQSARCPVCGTRRVVRLRSPDRIDRFHTGFLNMLERFAGHGRLYHCRWCRLQFYDRRQLASELPKDEPESETEDRLENRVDHLEDPAGRLGNPADHLEKPAQ
jgi:DNA-directed RNA polymerase subunit RPC12/RpoP